MKENSICGDNRFEIIEKAKEMLLNATNIEDSKEEMKVLTNILFRMWQVGLINEEKLDINKLQKENSIEEDIKLLEELDWLYLDKPEIICDRYEEATNHILSDYKRVLKENEELKNKEATQRKINELLVQRYSNSISVQKVKDKIIHYQELQDNYIKKYDEINEGLQAMINVLQELIEESEE